jgi:hypothetical protein
VQNVYLVFSRFHEFSFQFSSEGEMFTGADATLSGKPGSVV